MRKKIKPQCSTITYTYTYCRVGIIPEPSEAGAGEIGVIGPPGLGVSGYKLALDGGITGVGVGPKPNACSVPGETIGLWKRKLYKSQGCLA